MLTMKYLSTTLLIALFAVFFTSCSEESTEHQQACTGDIEICQDHIFSDHENVPEGYEQDIQIPLRIDESCGCIVEGVIRYTKGGELWAYVDYGNGDCDPTVIVRDCSGGDCDHHKKSGSQCCQFLQYCGNNAL